MDEHACIAANVLVFSLLSPLRLSRLREDFSLKHLQATIVITTDYQAPLLIELKGVSIKPTNALSLGIKVWVMTIQSILTFVRLEIDILKDTPDA